MKLNEGSGAESQSLAQPQAAAQSQAPAGAAGAHADGVRYNAAGARVTPKTAQPAAPAQPQQQAAAEAAPEGTDPLAIDLFESEQRMIVYVQVAGIAPGDIDIVADEESNTLLIQASQKRPDLPAVPGAKQGDAPEKGRFLKQEVKWASLYRKIYLPGAFDGAETEAMLNKGILTIILPAKKPGVGRKLTVRETSEKKNETQSKA